MTYICKYCNKECEKANQVACHMRWCELNPNRVRRKRVPKGNGKHHFLGRKHSEETKKLISEKRKKYLLENKNKHPWSKFSKRGETKPERLFRELIERTDKKVKQWFTPDEADRAFEIDFADIEAKIGFEINGNQHYESDRKTLKKYYQDRHDYFINLGWKILEIPYNICFNQDKLLEILQATYSDFILSESKIQEILNHRSERKIKREKALTAAKRLISVEWSTRSFTEKEIDSHLKSRKAIRPSKEELTKLLWEKPTTHIAKAFGVSDKAVEKWTKAYGLTKPPRGYWAKLAAQK